MQSPILIDETSSPQDITPLGIFGRFEGSSGQTIDVSLESASLQKAILAVSPDKSFFETVAAAGGFWRDDRTRLGRPLALVGIGLGPALGGGATADWFKQEFDEAKHPRWPSGNGDQSGEFKEKDGEANASSSPPGGPKFDAVVEAHVVQSLRRTAEKKAARAAVRMRLIAGLRVLAGVAADAVPFAGEAFDAYEIAQTIADFDELKTVTDAALDYAKAGPHPLDALRVSLEDESFSSARAFVKDFWEKRFGPAGDGYDYHHIVWQGGENAANIPPELLHSTENMIRMPRLLHEAINEAYREPYENTGLTLREWLDTQPYEVQRAEGIKVMRKLGIIK